MTFSHQKYRRPFPVALPDRRWPERLIEAAPTWCSVDLRDGNQALPEPMGQATKERYLKLLVEMGFREIELGFPSASQTDFDFVRWAVTSGVLPPEVTPQVLVQARAALIRRTFEALAGAPRAIVHVYNSTSELQRRVVFRKSRDEIRELAVEGVRLVRMEADAHPSMAVTLEYSPESFTGTELDYAVEVVHAVVHEWQPSATRPLILNLPSTVEMTTPNVFADQVETIARAIAGMAHVVLSVHTHNDRGTATASAELAQLAGATRVEGTLFGNGERSGNVDLVTLAMNLYSQGIDPKLDLSRMPEIVAVVEECTGMRVGPRHPWVGEYVFTAFSGSHQDAIHKGMKCWEESDGAVWEVPYLPVDPSDMGRKYEEVVRINSQSGKSGVAHVLERDHGYHLPKALAQEVAVEVQALADSTGAEITSETIARVFQERFVAVGAPSFLESLSVRRSSDSGDCELSARIRWGSEVEEVHGVGHGPIEALSRAVDGRYGPAWDVIAYEEHARGEGRGAEAVAYLAVEGANGQRRWGVGVDRDVTVASLKALLAALERWQRASV